MKKNSNVTKSRFTPLTIFLLIVLIVYVATLFFIGFWIINTASKEYYGDYFSLEGGDGNIIGLPKKFMLFDNIKEINTGFAKHTLVQMAGYTIAYSVGCSLAKVVVTCIVAYLCSQYRNVFSKIVYNIVIVSMLLPIIGSQSAELQMAKELHLYGQIWGLWIMRANFLGLYFLIFYEVFKAIPRGFYEAATIDGANDTQLMVNIAMPLVKYTFLTILLLVFIEYWNDYLTPNLYLPKFTTLSLALYLQSNNGQELKTTKLYLQKTPYIMASVVVVATPVILLFIAFNKRLMGNLSVGGIKG